MMFSRFRHLLLGLAIYEGFLKWWYPQIIHFRLGFSSNNKPPIYLCYCFLQSIYGEFGGRLTIAVPTLYIAFAFNQLTPIRGHICRGDGFGAPGLESHWEPGKV